MTQEQSERIKLKWKESMAAYAAFCLEAALYLDPTLEGDGLKWFALSPEMPGIHLTFTDTGGRDRGLTLDGGFLRTVLDNARMFPEEPSDWKPWDLTKTVTNIQP